MKRKRRSDRNHLIYEIRCILTDEHYIGVTVMKGNNIKRTLAQRWKAHQYKAFKLNEPWTLPVAVREYGEDAFEVTPVKVIRGKADAFAFEADLINNTLPILNSKFRKK